MRTFQIALFLFMSVTGLLTKFIFCQKLQAINNPNLETKSYDPITNKSAQLQKLSSQLTQIFNLCPQSQYYKGFSDQTQLLLWVFNEPTPAMAPILPGMSNTTISTKCLSDIDC